MGGHKALLAFIVALTLCGTIVAEDSPTEDGEERGIKGSDGLLKQDDNATNETSTGIFGRRPCNCKDSGCRCCLRTFFPIPPLLRQRACLNLTYPDNDTGLNMVISFNRRTLYNATVRDQGRNPVPICVSPPLFPRAELCAQLHDVYVKRQNMHACLKVEGHFSNRTLFGRTMGCMYVGPNGFAILRPDTDGNVPGIDASDGEPEVEADIVEEKVDASKETSVEAVEAESPPAEAAAATKSVETKNEEVKEEEEEETKKEVVKDGNEIFEV